MGVDSPVLDSFSAQPHKCAVANEHPLNAPGDFYVEHGCCTACGVPGSIAPSLFAWDVESHCYVSKQPSDPTEFDAMVEAMGSSEVDCIRYRGRDVSVLTRLIENGDAKLLDARPPPGVAPIVRDHVTFRFPQVSPAELTRDKIIGLALGDFRRFLRRQGQPRRRWRVEVPIRQQHTIRFAWSGGMLHTVDFEALDQRPGYLLARHTSREFPGGRGVSRNLHQWLTAFRASDIRWYTADQWKAGEEGTTWPA